MGCVGGKNIGEGGNHGSIVLGGHSTHKDGVELIHVCSEDVLHEFEGADGEHARDISVHCACVEVSKGSKKTYHVQHRFLRPVGDC